MMGYGKVAAFAELGHFFIFQLRDRYDYYQVYVLSTAECNNRLLCSADLVY